MSVFAVAGKVLPVEVVGRLATRLMRQGRFEQADQTLAAALPRAQSRFALHELYALSAHNSARYKLALTRWRKARCLDPDHAMPWCGIAANLRELGRVKEAVEVIEEALIRFADEYLILSEASRIYEQTSEYAKAADVSKRIIDLPAPTEDVSNSFLTNLFRSRRYDEAERYLNEIYQKDPRAKARRWATTAGSVASLGDPVYDMHLTECVARIGRDAFFVPVVAEWTSDLSLAFDVLRDAIKVAPTDSEIRESLVRILIRQDHLEDAVDEVSKHLWPSRTTPTILNGLIEMRKGDLRKVALYLTDDLSKSNADPAAQALMERTRQLAELLSIGNAKHVPLDAETTTLDNETRDLMLQFESIGTDCQFGLVQRHYGAEPLGLLRWTSTNFDMLIAGLKAEFSGLGDKDRTELIVGPGREIYVRDATYGLMMHTFITDREVSLSVLHPKMCRRFAYLKTKFISDLEEGKKILVYKQDKIDTDDLWRLREAVHAFGRASILAVQLGEPRVPAVQELGPGLYMAFISSTQALGMTTEDLATWLEICRYVSNAAREHVPVLLPTAESWALQN